MKFRFRPSDNQRPKRLPPPLASRKGLRLMGRDKLGRLPRLPEPMEQIRLSDEELFGKKKRRKSFRQTLFPPVALVYSAFKKTLLQMYREVYLFIRRAALAAKALFLRGVEAIKEKRAKRTPPKFDSLPMLLGALTSLVLVSALSGVYVLFGLFAYYGRSYRTVIVPDFSGSVPSEISYDKNSFELNLNYQTNPDVPEGTVISQIPSAGAVRRIYGRDGRASITLTVSMNKKVYVPEGLTGSSLRNATLALKNSGIEYSLTEVYSSTVPSGHVIRVSPSSNTEIESGGKVELKISLGPKIKTVLVPKLTGLSESDAIARLQASGLKLGEVRYQSSLMPSGIVISQSTRGDTSVPEGSTISFTVAIN